MTGIEASDGLHSHPVGPEAADGFGVLGHPSVSALEVVVVGGVSKEESRSGGDSPTQLGTCAIERILAEQE